MTSRYEGFPNALVEALSVGLPAIVFECHDGIKEIVQHGENGLLIPDKNVSRFITAMELLMNDQNQYQKLSRNARMIPQKFSFDKFYSEWDHLFQEIIT